MKYNEALFLPAAITGVYLIMGGYLAWPSAILSAGLSN